MSAQASGARLLIYPDVASLTRAVSDCVVRAADEAIASRGCFTWMLSGGSTPRSLYAHLAQPQIASQIDWPRVHLFWGDERCVPPHHPQSNFHLAWETLLSHVPLPAENIHRIRGELPPDQAADEYEREIRAFFSRHLPQSMIISQEAGVAWPIFDLILLGMGEDGHVASLFPGHAALDEAIRWAVAIEHSQPPLPLGWRVSVTLPLINSGRRVALLVSGKGKAARLRQVLAESSGGLPVQKVHPNPGSLVWFVDRAAFGSES